MVVLAVPIALLVGALLGVGLHLLLVRPLRAALDARPVIARAVEEPAEPDDDGAPRVVVLDVLDSGPERERPARRLPDLAPALAPLGAGAVLAAADLLGPRLLDAAGLPLSTLRVLGGLAVALTGLLLLAPALGARARDAVTLVLPRRSEEPASPLVPSLLAGLAALPVAGPVLAALTPDAAASDARVVVPAVVLAAALAGGLVLAPRLRVSPDLRHAGAVALVAGLALAVAVLLVPHVGRLPEPVAAPASAGSPPGTSPSPGATESYTALGGSGRLVPFADPENRALSRCVPGSVLLRSCGTAPRIRFEGWINLVGDSPPRLRGRPTILTLFSATCLTCVRDLARTQRLADAYPQASFVGVHTAEYPLETREVVERMLARSDVTFPVALDTDSETFDAYRSQVWPAHYLIDARGTVRAIAFGAGGLETLERGLRTLLTEEGGVADLPGPQLLVEPAVALIGRTPTIRLFPGQAGYAGVPRYLSTEASRYQPLPGEQPLSTYGLQGRWDVRRDSLRATSPASVLRLRYRASNVEAVVTGEGFISVVSEDGFRTIAVRGPGGLLRLATSESASDRTIRLLPSPGVRLWGFAFE